MVTNRVRSPEGTPPRTRTRTVAGLLLVTAGASVLLAIITAEALYPADYRSSGLFHSSARSALS